MNKSRVVAGHGTHRFWADDDDVYLSYRKRLFYRRQRKYSRTKMYVNPAFLLKLSMGGAKNASKV
jgi:hypothetical protein